MKKKNEKVGFAARDIVLMPLGALMAAVCINPAVTLAVFFALLFAVAAVLWTVVLTGVVGGNLIFWITVIYTIAVVLVLAITVVAIAIGIVCAIGARPNFGHIGHHD